MPLLLSICLSSGNDSYDFFLLPIAVAYDKDTQGRAQTQKNKALLVLRMLRVRQNPRVLIQEGATSFLEGDAVLLTIRTVLTLVPFKYQIRHGGPIVTTL